MNRSLDERCNRDMQQKTWRERGIDYASELCLSNTRDLVRILSWNVNHDIFFYRCTSSLFPWNSEYELSDLPDWPQISENLSTVGDLIERHDMRFSFHPDHWCKLATESDDTLVRTIESLNNHGRWLDEIGVERSPRFPINIHVGGIYGDKAKTIDRFRSNLGLLDPGARQRLTVENDDSESQWDVWELSDGLGDLIPVTFDYHHHALGGERPYRESFERARETWDCRPVTHYSEPARLWGVDSQPRKHSWSVSGIPEWMTRESDVMIEALSKEKAVLNRESRVRRETPQTR